MNTFSFAWWTMMLKVLFGFLLTLSCLEHCCADRPISTTKIGACSGAAGTCRECAAVTEFCNECIPSRLNEIVCDPNVLNSPCNNGEGLCRPKEKPIVQRIGSSTVTWNISISLGCECKRHDGSILGDLE